MRVTCERCLRRYDVPDATVKGRKIRARCKCGARVVVQDEERAAQSSPAGSHTTGSIQRPARWFVDITSWEPIAMDLRQLIRAFDAGRIDADTLVWRKGMPDWRRLREVAELADRLIGTDAAQKSATSENVTEGFTSEPPARQSERSRTPPASYTVGAKPQADASPRLSAHPTGDDDARSSSSSPPRAESTGTSPGLSNGAAVSNGAETADTSSLPSERVASLPPAVQDLASQSRLLGSRKPRGRSSTGRSNAGASRPGKPSSGTANGRSDRLSSIPGQGRTITQTGLSAPPDLNRRLSVPPGSPSQKEAEGAGRPSMPAAPGSSPRNSRESRNPTLIGAPRRTPSSDETPAQKPSSISVPPGAMNSAPQRHRGKHLLALAAVVLGGVLLAQRFILGERVEGDQLSARAEPPAQPKRVERTALESKPSPGVPDPPSAPSSFEPSTSADPSSEGGAAQKGASPEGVKPAPSPASSSSASSPTLPSEPVSTRQRLPAPAPPKAASQQVARPDRRALPSSDLSLATEEPSWDLVPPSEPTRKVAEEEKPGAPARSPENSRGSELPAAEAAKEPSVGDTPPLSPGAPSLDMPSEPRAFALEQAQQQLGAAAIEASRCGSLGTTRGSGKVNVSVATWGRVVRVAHLNQAFVGTPVGVCVMEAFQKVQVPPFDGTTQTVTSSFLIQ